MKEKNVNFSIRQLAETDGISHLDKPKNNITMNKSTNSFRQESKLLRLQDAQRMKQKAKECPEVWTKDVAYYLDGVFFFL